VVRDCSRISLKPEAKIQLEFRAQVSLSGTFGAWVKLGAEATAGYSVATQTAVLSSGLDVTAGYNLGLTSTCDLRLTPQIVGGFAFTFGVGPDLFFLPTEDKVNDLAKIIAPYYENKWPILFQLTSDPTLPNGTPCNNCNKACPRGRFSMVPTLAGGIKVCC
jgi:hypothetical protein